MPMSENEKLVVIAVVGLVIGLTFVYYGVPYLQSLYAVTPAPTYTTDLTVQFKVFDDTSKTTLTSNISPDFYESGTDPLVRGFTGSPTVTGSYDATDGVWETVLDAGSYVCLVQDTAGSKTKYPTLEDVTVEGTDLTDREVQLSPYMLHMVKRASVTLSTSILAYNVTSGAYDISVANINDTAYSKWRVHFQISVAGTNYELKAGRIYMTKVTNLSPISATLDGSTVSVLSDTDASDDSLTGYFVSFDDMLGGTVHDLYVYFEAVGTVASTTMTFTVADYYECQNTNLKWWTYSTSSVTVI